MSWLLFFMVKNSLIIINEVGADLNPGKYLQSKGCLFALQY